MKRWFPIFSLFVLLGGCRGTPFLIADFEDDYRPKLKTVVFMPFSIPVWNRLAEQHRLSLEETITNAIARSDSQRSLIFPGRLRLQFKGLTDSSILRLPADSVRKLFFAEALFFTDVIRLYQSEGSNPTSREIGAAKFQRRGVELMMEFRLVETASGKLLWRYRVRRFGEDVEAAIERIGVEVAKRWPLKI